MTVPELAAATEVHRLTIPDALNQWVAAGLLTAEIAGRILVYRAVDRLPEELPALTRLGKPRPASGQQRMWTAMKPLPSFTPAELALCAQVPEVAVCNYLGALHRTGYLAVLDAAWNGPGGGRTRYRLILDTGPLAPAIRRDKTVFDRNREIVMATMVPAGGKP